MRATAISRTIAGMLLLPILVGATAEAQVIFPGSTLEGDYLRGVGLAAWGMGQYNLNTAQANQINAQTSIMLNEYIWASYKNEMKERAEYRRAMRERNAENYRKYHDRIENHPNSHDLDIGDALNAKRSKLLAPNVDESSSRSANVRIPAEFIRRIPFKLGEKGETFSLNRLSLRGIRSVAFQDPSFTSYIAKYQRTVDDAMELAMDRRMTERAITAMEKAFAELHDKFQRTPHLRDPDHQREYVEAKEQLDKMRRAPRLFQTDALQEVFKEIDSYTGTTVYDLLQFMGRHKLTFAPAETAVEREIYPRLYEALCIQDEKSIAQ